MNTIITRFAPSPTGQLHIGGIRTALIKDGILYIQAGGGLVADSKPELEWKELLNKGRAIFKAAEMVQEKLKG